MSHTLYKDFGGIFRFYLSIIPYVILLDPKDIQTVLGSAKHTRKIYFYRLLDNFLGKGLLTSNVETWKKHRKILLPGFHQQVLQKFINSFTESADRLSKRLMKCDGQDINITKFVNDSVYEILNG